MDKPTFPKILILTAAEIRAVRAGFRMTQANFGRFFPVSMDTVRSWENGRSRPYGPCSARLTELKAYVDHVKAERAKALNTSMGKIWPSTRK